MNKKYILAVMLLPATAEAHIGLSHVTGFVAGMSHPLTGLDHLCAMIAVGLWAKQQGGKAQYAIPAAFVGTMIVGAALGQAGVPLPGVEAGIAASVLVLGLLTASALKVNSMAAGVLVGMFAMFHGHAHGAEMPVSVSGYQYGLGFVVSTIALHAAGLALGSVMQQRAVRYAGLAISLAGVALLIK